MPHICVPQIPGLAPVNTQKSEICVRGVHTLTVRGAKHRRALHTHVRVRYVRRLSPVSTLCGQITQKVFLFIFCAVICPKKCALAPRVWRAHIRHIIPARKIAFSLSQ